MTDTLDSMLLDEVQPEPPAPATRNSEMPTSGFSEGAPTETITAGQSGSPSLEPVQISELGLRGRAARAYAASRAYWTPPSVFTQRPASLQDLAAYARTAPWTHQRRGFIRGLGVAWYRLIAFPITVLLRYLEWFAQRPLRAFTLFGIVKLISLTGPGHWAVQHVVYPAAQLAGQIFL